MMVIFHYTHSEIITDATFLGSYHLEYQGMKSLLVLAVEICGELLKETMTLPLRPLG